MHPDFRTVGKVHAYKKPSCAKKNSMHPDFRTVGKVTTRLSKALMRNEEFNAPGFSHRWKGTRSKALMRKEEFHAPGFSYRWKGEGGLILWG